MDQIIRAIETEYKGYRFRSRLEARWAVFFDALKVQWDYEVEGFQVGNLFYLPDFVITNEDMEIYIEIKPTYPNQSEIQKAKAVAAGMNTVVVIMNGDPYGNYIEHKESLFIDQTGEIYPLLPPASFLWTGVMPLSKAEEIIELADQTEGEKNKEGVYILHSILPIVLCQRAAKKSRKARFEHGEKG